MKRRCKMTSTRKHFRLLPWFALSAWTALALAAAGEGAQRDRLDWSRLPACPPPEGRDTQIGFAGMFAGAHNGALIVAGGANFADGPSWEGGKKIWYDDIYVLEQGEAGGEPETTTDGKPIEGGPRYRWTRAETKLPRALGYGASVSAPDGVICIGGLDLSDEGGARYADVFRLEWNPESRTVAIENLPPLPETPTTCCAGLIDGVLYVTAYIEPETGEARKRFWALDLANASPAAWRQLEPWAGPALIGPVCGVQDGNLFLFGGSRPEQGADGKPCTTPSMATYRFAPGKRQAGGVLQAGEWTRVADIPRPVLAAPSPAQPMGQSHLLAFAGSDRVRFDGAPAEHPGFSNDVLAYHTITDTWRIFGAAPAGVVGAPAVLWGDRILVVSGELRPCVRNPDILVARIRPLTARFGLFNWAVLVGYLGLLVWMGFYFSAREKSTEDFFLAGRRIPGWAAGISLFGTGLSAITFMAVPAKAFVTDWTFWLSGLMGVLTVPITIFLLIPFFRRLNVRTSYEYLEKRFNLPTRWIGSSLFILSQIGRMGIVLFLPALALSTVTGINVYICILLMGVLCTFYTVLGGVEAVIWTDVLQSAILLGAALLSLILIVASVEGGPAHVFSTAVADGKLRLAHLTWDYTMPALWIVLISHVLGVINAPTDQSVVQRWMTTRNERQAVRAVWVGAVFGFIGSTLFFSVGTALYVFFKSHPSLLEPGLKNDAVYPLFIMRQLPAGVSGLIIAGVFSAAMSSLDSAMNAVSMAITNDFVKRLKPDVTEHGLLNLARWLTVILGVFGTAVAAALVYFGDAVTSVWDVYLAVMGLFLGGLGGLFAAGILTRRAGGAGAIAGIIASAAVVFYVQRFTSLHFFLYGAIGIATCFIVTYVVSVLLPFGRKPTEGLTIYTFPDRVD